MEQWKTAVIGALGGATIALVIVFGAAAIGLLPGRAAIGQTVREYLLANPEMGEEMTQALAEKRSRAEVNEMQVAVDRLGPKALLDPRVAFITGPANAKTTIVEFFDYNCPYCRVSVPALKKYYAKHKDETRFVLIEFPIKGEESVLATRASIAARRQPGKYLPFHFALMEEEGLADAALVDAVAQRVGLDLEKLHADMEDPEIAKTIALSEMLARRAKINGTPIFIVNGNVRPGAVNDEFLAELVNQKKRG